MVMCTTRHYNGMMTAYDEILEHDSDPDWAMSCTEICANIRPNDLDGDLLEKTLYFETHIINVLRSYQCEPTSGLFSSVLMRHVASVLLKWIVFRTRYWTLRKKQRWSNSVV